MRMRYRILPGGGGWGGGGGKYAGTPRQKMYFNTTGEQNMWENNMVAGNVF